jgi:Tol biopolymer transport system component
VYIRDLWTGTVELAGLGNSGNVGNSASGPGYLSPDARLVYFSSEATNLVLGDTNNSPDVFVRDRVQGTTTRVTLTSTGGQANQGGNAFRIAGSADTVVFESESTNLVPGDTNGKSDIFVRDIDAGTTTRVSVSSTGTEANNLSVYPDITADGHMVVFTSLATNLIAGDTNGQSDVFLHDRTTQQTSRISVTPSGGEANHASYDPCISANGRFVAFASLASNIVAGDTNGAADIFLRDLVLGTNTRVSVSSAGAQANDYSETASISGDGRRVTFDSSATNFVPGGTLGLQVFLRDLSQSKTFLISQSTSGAMGNGQSYHASICSNGRQVAFLSWASNLVPGDTNNYPDAFVRELDPTPPIAYCPPKTNSAGCVPSISASGAASYSSTQPFWIDGAQVLNDKSGLLFYSRTSSTFLPFQGGWLCVMPPLRRTIVATSGGSPPPIVDCTGLYHFDFNAWLRSGGDPALRVGQVVWAQFWSRDPGYAAPNNTGLTNALAFEIGS